MSDELLTNCPLQRGITVFNSKLTLAVFGFFVLLGATPGCGATIETKKIRVENIKRVFMHEGHDFTFGVSGSDPEKKELVLKRFKTGYTAQIYEDVPADKPMWAEIVQRYQGERCLSTGYSMEIHIHSSAEVEGGAWERRERKQTVKGMTQVIK